MGAINRKDYYFVIFSPAFAKAYWGKQALWSEKSKLNNFTNYRQNELAIECGFEYDWQYYQHKMLDEIQKGKNPLKYLETFL